ncbi:MAG: hypothetical protein MUC78_13585 [Bacteroidales bacterium]|jgi:hypothetical protein|nr:hypothetical protein [Bacteroidales bacterium]
MKTEQVLNIFKVFAWIVFIGLCIKTGALMVSFGVSLFVNPAAAADLYMDTDLSAVMAFGKIHYIVMAALMIILSGSKAWLSFWVVKITDRLSLTEPFSESVAGLISGMSIISLQIGLLALATDGYAQWLNDRHVNFTFESSGTDFLFLAGILYIIAIIFRRGIELRRENELTI